MLILSIGDRLVTCMVRAKQRNHLMFTAAASLIDKHSSIREKVLEHSRANPYISVPQNPAVITGEGAGNGLFESRVVDSGIVKDLVRSSGKRYRRFVRSRGTISNSGGFNEPLLALTYLTDTYLIKAPCDESTIYHLALLHHLQIRKSQTKRPKNSKWWPASTIPYLHHPQAIRVDDWMRTEMETPRAGNEQGLVIQRIWSTDGVLVATCIQEVSQSSLSVFTSSCIALSD